jgi:hypothetical protein
MSLVASDLSVTREEPDTWAFVRNGTSSADSACASDT